MVLLIVLGSILVYLAVGMALARPVYVEEYRDWERRSEGRRYGTEENWAGLKATGVTVGWPFYLAYQVLNYWFSAPMIKEDEEAEKREEQIKFWSQREQDTSISVAERETASQVLRVLRGQ